MRVPVFLRLALAVALACVAAPSFAQPAPGGLNGGYWAGSGCNSITFTGPNGARTMMVDANGNLCISGSISATTSATASATPTAVSAGTGKPINISLNSGLFSEIEVGGTLVSSGAPFPTTCVSGCSGGPADESAFTAGTTLTFTGGFFQTTATSNPLTNGQLGIVQMTAQRAFFTNLRNASGTEVGTAAAPLPVSLANTAANGTAVLTTGTGGTFPITAASLPLPTGAATAANQTNVQAATGAGVPANANYTGMNVSGNLTGLIGTSGGLSTNTAQVGGNAVATGTGAVGSGSQRVAVAVDSATIGGSAPSTVLTTQGVAASGATASGNPNLGGCLAVNAPQTAVTNGQAVAAECDLNGKQITSPYANKENFTSGCANTTGTSGVSVIGTPGAGLKLYITTVSVANTGSTTSLITLQSDPTGTPVTLWTTISPTASGSNFTFPVPLVVPANKAFGFTGASASTTQYVCASGYIGA